MKTILLSTAGAVLLAGGLVAFNAGPTEAATEKTIVTYNQNGSSYSYNEKAIASDITKLPEYSTLASKVDLANYTAHIVEDNASKRIIVLRDANGREQIKSLFIKRENRLKIVDYRGGLLFNELIENTASTETAVSKVSGSESQLPEYQELSAITDLTKLTAHVVEDNYSKRITLFKDEKGHAVYKTIFVKKTGFVKVITL